MGHLVKPPLPPARLELPRTLMVCVGLPAGAFAIIFYAVIGPAFLVFLFGLGGLATLVSASNRKARRKAVQRMSDWQLQEARENAAVWDNFLAPYHPKVHLALQFLLTPDLAPVVWEKVGLGTWVEGNRLATDFPVVVNSIYGPVVYQTPFGARITLLMRMGQTPGDFVRAADKIANTLELQYVRVFDGGEGRVTLDLGACDPLKTPLHSPLVDETTGELLVKPGQLTSKDDIILGYSDEGDPVVINLADSAHGAIQGITRSGKSITVNTFLAHASLMRDVQLIILDPNLAAAAPWWRTAHEVSDQGDPSSGPTEILRRVRDLMEERKALFFSMRTDKLTEFSPELPLVLLVIDEISNYTNWSDKKVANAFRSELRAIASQGAKFGIRLWLLGQKLEADVLDTATRTNLSARICHRVSTGADFKHLFPEELKELGGLTAADPQMPQGTAIASVPGRWAPFRMRSVFLSSAACWRIADAIVEHSGLVRNEPTSQARLVAVDKLRAEAEEYEEYDAPESEESEDLPFDEGDISWMNNDRDDGVA